MSKFSGKCDLYDWFGMIACVPGETPYECYKRLGSEIFYSYGGDDRPVRIEKPSDLVMFYPFIAGAHIYSKDGDDIHWIPRGSYLADIVTYAPGTAARYLQELLDEYWRVREEEDPKYESKDKNNS